MTLDLSMLALLGLLVVSLSALHWWLRARVEDPAGPIRVIASRGIGAKRALTIVEIEGRRLLLGLTDERIVCLSELGATVASRPKLRRVSGAGERS